MNEVLQYVNPVIEELLLLSALYGSGELLADGLVAAFTLLLGLTWASGRTKRKQRAARLEEIEQSLSRLLDGERTEGETPKSNAVIEHKPAPLTQKLQRSRTGLLSRIKEVLTSSSVIDDETLEELEMVLITSDMGGTTASLLIERVKERAHSSGGLQPEEAFSLIESELVTILNDSSGGGLDFTGTIKSHVGPFVIMIVGVNGAGKTTTTAKLAKKCKDAGLSIMLAAADTFRAAAVEQLQEWGERVGVSVITGEPAAKPSGVAYQAVEQAIEHDVDVLLIDTAGRLHTKSNLMQELAGVRNAVSKHLSSAPHEVLLVVDGTSGQNALLQAKEFHKATPLDGVIITKLDGTSRGGIVVAIKNELSLPIRYIGVGESPEDLRDFDAREFASALLQSPVEHDGSDFRSEHAGVRRRRRRAAAAGNDQ